MIDIHFGKRKLIGEQLYSNMSSILFYLRVLISLDKTIIRT